ncbi:hypothetical protein L0156_27285 [bacterium]|nr:hypothetical protein [bacterium]
MDKTIEDKIIKTVHADEGWKMNEVRVDEVDELRHGSCSFYTAGHKVRPLSYELNYAVLKGDTIISLADEKAASKIIDACGADAGAGWWAEIITRFHQDLGSGLVLQDAKQNPGATRKIQAAQKEFAPPALGNEGGNKIVTYYLLEPESFAVYTVKATKNPDGTFTVERNSIRKEE